MPPPAAFYVGLLNSQPMGFYSPSQLIQDARRHHIMVLPVDVNHSSWDHQILSSADQQQPPIRLGLRLIKGLSEAAGNAFTPHSVNAFANVADLRQRACLDRGDMEALAAADASRVSAAIAINPIGKPWRWKRIARYCHMTVQHSALRTMRPSPRAYAPRGRRRRLSKYRADSQVTSPVLAAPPTPFDRCRRQTELETLGNHRFVRVAGLVTCRQRRAPLQAWCF